MKIFWSMSGEGRGHATRVRALVERLRREHECALFAPGDAHDFLAPLYRGTDVRVERIPGLRFHYRGCRLDAWRTAGGALRYVLGFRRLLAELTSVVRSEQPDLIVTDFEPALPRAAARCGVPYISLDHQHFLVVCDLSELPAKLRRRVLTMRTVVRSYYSGQRETVVSSFYRAPLRRGVTNVRQIGVILRPEVLEADPTNDGHLVVYLRRFAPPNVLDALADSGREVHVYGLRGERDRGNLRFRRIDAREFVRDLASSDALISTAGNQIVGEALHLTKPVLMMPEANNHEQFINAWFLKRSGAGDYVELDRCSADVIHDFLARVPEFRRRAAETDVDGTEDALRTIRSYVGGSRARERDVASVGAP